MGLLNRAKSVARQETGDEIDEKSTQPKGGKKRPLAPDRGPGCEIDERNEISPRAKSGGPDAPSQSREAPTDGRAAVPGWSCRGGRWYAPGFEGLETPFDEEPTLSAR
jgi:hypothetical protein